jgi:hypothetical protein
LPPGVRLPAWNADSKGFDTSGLWEEIPGVDMPQLEQWQVAMPHVVATIDGGASPGELAVASALPAKEQARGTKRPPLHDATRRSGLMVSMANGG